MKTLIILILLCSCTTDRFYMKHTKRKNLKPWAHHYYCIENAHGSWYTKEQMRGR